MSTPPGGSDPDLLTRYGRGDHAAFALLVDRYAPRLRSYLRRRAGAQDSDDILQEVFLRLVKNARGLVRRDTIESWLFSVARNLTLDHRRAERRWTFVANLDDAAGEPRPGAGDALRPDVMMEARLLGERIERAVASLPDHEREVFLLRQYSRLSFREIAALLGIPLNTALSRMHRAVERLRTTPSLVDQSCREGY